MNRRQLLAGIVAAPLAGPLSNVVPFPLGTATVSHADLFLAPGAIINWNSDKVVAVHAGGAFHSV